MSRCTTILIATVQSAISERGALRIRKHVVFGPDSRWSIAVESHHETIKTTQWMCLPSAQLFTSRLIELGLHTNLSIEPREQYS